MIININLSSVLEVTFEPIPQGKDKQNRTDGINICGSCFHTHQTVYFL